MSDAVCRWGGCGAPAVYEFRCQTREPRMHAASNEFYCEGCARLARQCYAATTEGAWPNPEVPATEINLPILAYDWLSRIEVARIAPWPVGSEQWLAIEAGLISLARGAA